MKREYRSMPGDDIERSDVAYTARMLLIRYSINAFTRFLAHFCFNG